MRTGWFGHQNLGDDEMKRILDEHLPGIPTFGGGTLISPHSEFYKRIRPGMVGVSLGVSANWNGEGVEQLKKLAAIYVRDIFSYDKLRAHGLSPRLSVDLWNVHTHKEAERTLHVANLINLSHKDDEAMQARMLEWRRLCEGKEFFAMSPVEDLEMMGEAKVFEDGGELIVHLSRAKTAVVTRLHAYVAAWIAKVPHITAFHYDEKCKHFEEMTRKHTQEEAHKIIMEDLEEIRNTYGKHT